MSARNNIQSGFFLPIVLAVIVAFAAGYFANIVLPSTLLNTPNPSSKSSQPSQDITLPTGLVKISGCIPFEGEHWVRPQDLPHGPFYVTNDKKVTAVEYMIEPEEIPGKDYAAMPFPQFIGYMQKNNLGLNNIVDELQSLSFDLSNAKYTYSDIHWTAPHAGQLKPHYDIHFYLQPKSEMKKVCPEATLQDVFPEALMQDLSKQGVPLPQ